LLTVEELFADAMLAEQPKTVLVVDDDPAVLNSLRFALEIEGYVVATFPGARDVLAAPLPSAACLVIDHNLPGMNGLELLAELRRLGADGPAVLVTSHPPQILRDRAAAAGLAIIEKPLLGNALIEMIRKLTNGRNP
jgi:FixJ family two-component response regulator